MGKYIKYRLSAELSVKDLPHVKIVKYEKLEHYKLIPLLYASGFDDDPWNPEWDQSDEFDADGVFLAQKENKFIGFIICFQRNDSGHISVLTILPEYRGNKYSFVLIREAINYLRNNGLNEITINVEPANDAAIYLYEEIGFKADL